jgi:hypothetical protein
VQDIMSDLAVDVHDDTGTWYGGSLCCGLHVGLYIRSPFLLVIDRHADMIVAVRGANIVDLTSIDCEATSFLPSSPSGYFRDVATMPVNAYPQTSDREVYRTTASLTNLGSCNVLWSRFFGAASLMYDEVRRGCLLLGVEPHLRCCAPGNDAACCATFHSRYLQVYRMERGLIATYH